MTNQSWHILKIFSHHCSQPFEKNYGCQSTLLNMVQHFKNCIDNGQFVGCIGMDLSKAFDCLPRRLTICKLRAYGASRNACTLLASYLYCRK